MAPDVAAVEALLEELRLASYSAAVKDLEDLKAFAAEKGAPEAWGFEALGCRFLVGTAAGRKVCF
jgi:hypothetical protein